MQNEDQRLFVEVQHMRSVWWVMVLIAGVAALSWWGFIQQIVLGQPWGTNPGPDWMVWLMWLLMGIGFPIAFWIMRLEVSVYPTHVGIRYVPMLSREIAMDEISAVVARDYKALREYGGWGVRGLGSKRAYNVKGNAGVELTLSEGRKVMLGSQRAPELALAIETAREEHLGR